jgi:5-methylcytosine-specific restriction endonuclease McrA
MQKAIAAYPILAAIFGQFARCRCRPDLIARISNDRNQRPALRKSIHDFLNRRASARVNDSLGQLASDYLCLFAGNSRNMRDSIVDAIFETFNVVKARWKNRRAASASRRAETSTSMTCPT